jgi:hypothetical protein
VSDTLVQKMSGHILKCPELRTYSKMSKNVHISKHVLNVRTSADTKSGQLVCVRTITDCPWLSKELTNWRRAFELKVLLFSGFSDREMMNSHAILGGKIYQETGGRSRRRVPRQFRMRCKRDCNKCWKRSRETMKMWSEMPLLNERWD